VLERVHYQAPSQVKLIRVHRHRFGIGQGGGLVDLPCRQGAVFDGFCRSGDNFLPFQNILLIEPFIFGGSSRGG